MYIKCLIKDLLVKYLLNIIIVIVIKLISNIYFREVYFFIYGFLIYFDYYNKIGLFYFNLRKFIKVFVYSLNIWKKEN